MPSSAARPPLISSTAVIGSVTATGVSDIGTVLAAIRADFDAGRADENETSAAIRAIWREAGDLVDPHTAVALAVADRDASDASIPNIVLSTAHAAKFPDASDDGFRTPVLQTSRGHDGGGGSPPHPGSTSRSSSSRW